MSTLHLIFSLGGLRAARARVTAADTVLLIADGTYAADGNALMTCQAIYALAEDLQTRGIPPHKSITVVDYAGMVELTTRHQPVVSWRE